MILDNDAYEFGDILKNEELDLKDIEVSLWLISKTCWFQFQENWLKVLYSMIGTNNMGSIIKHCSNINYEDESTRPVFTNDKQVQQFLNRMLTLLTELDQTQKTGAVSTSNDWKNTFSIFNTSFLNLITVSEKMERNLLYINDSFVQDFISEDKNK